MFRVFLSNSSQKGYDRTEPKIKARLDELFEILTFKPVPADLFDVTKVSGSESNYRVRITHIRVVYSIRWHENEIRIHDIDKKKDRTYR